VVEPALVAVGVCAASVLVAAVIGLLFSRGMERLFRRGRRDSPPDQPEDAVTGDA
jgi:ABC-type spermidine/putrescine transport system permease subunit II